MSEMFSLEQYRRRNPASKPEAAESKSGDAPRGHEAPPRENAAAAKQTSAPQPKLTKAGIDFRARFETALSELGAEARAELKTATAASDLKTRITVSAVLKRAKASPLAAYSPLHKDALLPMVEAASAELASLVSAAFKPKTRRRPSATALQAQLKKERAEHAKALSKLASQRLAEFVAQEAP